MMARQAGFRDGGAARSRRSSACDELVGSPKYQVIRSQMMAPASPPKMTAKRDDVDVDHAGADGLGDRRAERERRDEVEEGRPDHRLAGREHARRHDRGDRVRRVVEAVDVIEDQRDENERDDDAAASAALAVLDHDAFEARWRRPRSDRSRPRGSRAFPSTS